MKGIKYRVRYCDSVLALTHGEYYETVVVHVPELKAEINREMIREENDSYTEEINGMIPEKLGEVEISDEDVAKIKSVLNFRNTVKDVINRIVDEQK